MTATKRTAASEFPGLHVPETIDLLVKRGIMEDTSWHNDACASFEVYGKHRREGYRLWLDHVKVENRECGEKSRRATVVKLAYAGHNGTCHQWESSDEAPVLATESVTEAVDFLMRFYFGVKVGDRVRFKTDWDVYPFTVVKTGATGTVIRLENFVVAIKLDAYDPELDEWDNEVHLPQDGCVDEDFAEFVAAVVEVV